MTPWNISCYKPPQIYPRTRVYSQPQQWSSRSRSPRSSYTPLAMGMAPSGMVPAILTRESFSPVIVQERGLDVSSQGNVSATFQVPGLISIPSDDIFHNVTITKLSLDAMMSWVCVPKNDTKTHLNVSLFFLNL